MVSQITNGIKISVKNNFERTYLKNNKIHFAFTYEITIENQSEDTVQLLSRHWDIYDSLNVREQVKGDGVLGLNPIIETGQKHRYSSGCLLCSPLGSMKGFYNMINLATNEPFRVTIPLFRLSARFALN